MINFINKYYIQLVAVLLCFYFAVGCFTIQKISPTGDEIRYFKYAVNCVKGNPSKNINSNIADFNSQTPIIILNTLPRGVIQVFNPEYKQKFGFLNNDLINRRYISAFISVLIGLLIVIWAKQLFGKLASLFSLVLYILCPNFLSQNIFVATDVYSYLFFGLSNYFLWLFCKKITPLNFWGLQFSIIFAVIAKPSMVLFLPIALIALFFKTYYKAAKFSKKITILFCFCFPISLIIVSNILYQFYNIGIPFGKFHFYSNVFQNLQKNLSIFSAIKIPFAEPFLNTFDYTFFSMQSNARVYPDFPLWGKQFFMGKPLNNSINLLYYPLSFLFKLPITILVFTFGLIVWFITNKQKISLLKDNFAIFFPAIIFLLYFIFFHSMYIGIRNLLFILIPLFVFLGGYLNTIISKRRFNKLLILSFIIFQSLSVGKLFPHFLPYTNELLWNKSKAYKVFGDFNIIYEEGILRLQNYLAKHPDIQFEPKSHTKGLVIVGIDSYYDWWNEGKMSWLKNLNIEPIDNFDTQYLIFNVP